MVKKITLGLLILTAAAGILGAQEEAKETKMAVGLDLFPMIKGIIWSDNDKDDGLFALAPSFEVLVHPHFTVGGALDMYFGKAKDVDIFYFGLAVHGRWYPLSTGLDKFFLDTGLGFNVFAYDGETDAKKGGFAGLTMSLKAGYKLMFTRNFYAKTSTASVPMPLGWQPGLNIGGAF